MTEPSTRSLVAESYRRIFSGRIMRFAAVGGIVTVFFMALNALFGRVAGLRPEVAFLVSYPPALALHFLLNKLWTFGDKTSTTHHQLGEYLFSVVVTFLIQWPAFTLLQKVLGLPDGYWDTYRAALRATDPAEAAAAAQRIFHPGKALVVVAGDADVIAEPLAHFGEVTVVDPEREFQTVKTIPAEGAQ